MPRFHYQILRLVDPLLAQHELSRILRVDHTGHLALRMSKYVGGLRHNDILLAQERLKTQRKFPEFVRCDPLIDHSATYIRCHRNYESCRYREKVPQLLRVPSPSRTDTVQYYSQYMRLQLSAQANHQDRSDGILYLPVP